VVQERQIDLTISRLVHNGPGANAGAVVLCDHRNTGTEVPVGYDDPRRSAVSKPVLQILIASTRPGRVGPAIAAAVAEAARPSTIFDVEVVDLATFALPVFDEPRHPILGDYEHEHTKRWAASVARGDAFIFVMPEYNHSFNAALKNALDYLRREWAYKPVGLVSYGGAAMGVRAIAQLKPVLAALKLFHTADVTISLQATPVVDGVYTGNDVFALSMGQLLSELETTYDFLTHRRA
jgi:NAD(P)H-dependent FMN reductase